ncbi:MAG TPA: hypothetical protein VF245_08620 [Solirubrobacterales bacterium]
MSVLACALFLCIAPQAANAAPLSSAPLTPSALGAAAKGGFHGISQKPSKTKPYTPCPLGGKVVVQCNIVIEPEPVKKGSHYYPPGGGPMLEGSGVEGGWSPADLQSAYGISGSGGEGLTVAVIDAYGYEAAESDLAEYRKQYGLPACTKANGCFHKVNQVGEEGNYPAPGPEVWAAESALDLDMVSAVCPKCNLLLVQASDEYPAQTAAAVETAVKLGATAISNSYGYMQNYQVLCPKEKGCTEYAAAYNHPGIPITVSAGDSGYDFETYAFTYGSALAGQPSWPAAASTVIAVGGTELEKAENARGWSEHVWPLSGGGCSKYVAKPAWQSDPDCETRMGNDVAAVAEGVSVYSTPYQEGWGNIGGTSVSAPLIAGIMAQAPKAVREEGPEAFYRRKLNDVTSGVNGTCRKEYLCQAQEGYDGPTGWGTPAGPLEELSTFGARTGGTSHRSAEGAKLIGAVYPAGTETTYYFEYGPSASYGFSTSSASAGSGTLWKGVAQSLSGLPDGTYHYRLVAAHGATKTYGSDRTFQTQTWSIQTTLNEETGLNPLTSVSCSSDTDCMAVGWRTKQNSLEPLAWSNRWNGGEWIKQKTANIGKATLTGVSCTASNACTAVGSGGSPLAPLAQRWNGSEWSTQTVPNPVEATEAAQLESVSCTGASSCMAVGWYQAGKAKSPFSETWNGSEWKTKSVPVPAGAVETNLSGISCTSSTSCKAIGRYSPGENYKSLAETWNGTEWTIQSMPEPADLKSELTWTGVSCSSESSCIAVGWYRTTSSVQNAMAARWNGSSWALQSLPALRQGEVRILEDVSCSLSTLCVAVGIYSYQDGMQKPLSLRWNGIEWSEQWMESIALPGLSDGIENPSALLGVSCASLRCESVGWKANDGWSWSLAQGSTQKVPNPPNATTEAATNAKTAEPTLNASVNPNGYETHYSFEYDTKEYKSGEAAHGTSVSAGDLSPSYLSQHVSYAVKGLKLNTTYHFRVVAENSLGLTRGADQSFTTALTPQWWSCTKQTGGRFSSSKCATEGSPNEWELLHLKEATKTTIAAKGNPISFATIQSGISTPFTCETEVLSPSLENPSGGANGVGNAEIKYKGCKAEGTWGEKGCKVSNTASPVTKLELAIVEGKTRVQLTPKEGESFATFTVSGCAGSKALEALNGTWSLTGSAYGLYSNASSKIELTSATTTGLKLRGQSATAVGSIVLETTAGGYISAQAVALLHWQACAKQGGGKYSSGKCTSVGAPNEWEILALKEAEKTTITAKGNLITFSSVQSGISTPFTCETEVASPSLENPSGGGNGGGSGEVKYKGCIAEGTWGEKGCKVTNTASPVTRLELVLIEEKAEVKLTPKEGESFATFTVSGCAGSKAYEALNGTWSLTGSAYGLYSNASSKIELTSATTTGLKLRGQNATAVGSIVLETTAGGYVRAE